MPSVKDILDRVGEPDRQPYMEKKRNRFVKILTGEIKRVCLAYPDHPLSLKYATSVAKLPDNYEVAVMQVDFQAIEQNRAIEVIETKEYPYLVTERRLGDKIETPLAEAPEENDVQEIIDGGDSSPVRKCCGG